MRREPCLSMTMTGPANMCEYSRRPRYHGMLTWSSSGVQPPISVVEDAYESFCNKFDGHTVAADGTWTNNTWTIKGNLVYLAVHAAGPNGKAFVLSYNNCIWGFEAVRDSCSINGGVSEPVSIFTEKLR